MLTVSDTWSELSPNCAVYFRIIAGCNLAAPGWCCARLLLFTSITSVQAFNAPFQKRCFECTKAEKAFSHGIPPTMGIVHPRSLGVPGAPFSHCIPFALYALLLSPRHAHSCAARGRWIQGLQTTHYMHSLCSFLRSFRARNPQCAREKWKLRGPLAGIPREASQPISRRAKRRTKLVTLAGWQSWRHQRQSFSRSKQAGSRRRLMCKRDCLSVGEHVPTQNTMR